MRPDEQRDPVFDNAKIVAIALVVVGHAIEPLVKAPAVVDLPLLRALYVAIYTFHMPVFILIAGRLSRNFTATPRQAKRLLSTIVFPYLVFEISYEYFIRYVGNGPSELHPLDPSYAMWFLTALFFWRITAPLWREFRPAYAVGITVVLSMLSGLVPMPDEFDLYRVFGFLPFFVLGLVLPDRFFELLRTPTARILAVPTLLAPFVASYFVFPDTQFGWLYYTYSYETMGVSAQLGMFGRVLALFAGVAVSAAFLAVLPARRLWFTSLGAGTLYVYLLHRYLVKTAEYSGIYEDVRTYTLPAVALIVGAALVVTVVLSSKPTRFLCQPLVEPRLSWLFRGSKRNDQGGRAQPPAS